MYSLSGRCSSLERGLLLAAEGIALHYLSGPWAWPRQRHCTPCCQKKCVKPKLCIFLAMVLIRSSSSLFPPAAPPFTQHWHPLLQLTFLPSSFAALSLAALPGQYLCATAQCDLHPQASCTG